MGNLFCHGINQSITNDLMHHAEGQQTIGLEQKRNIEWY